MADGYGEIQEWMRVDRVELIEEYRWDENHIGENLEFKQLLVLKRLHPDNS